MLALAFDFLIGALVAATFGFGGIPTAWDGLARAVFAVFLAAFAVTLFMGLLARGGMAWMRGMSDSYDERRQEGTG